LPFSATLNDS